MGRNFRRPVLSKIEVLSEDLPTLRSLKESKKFLGLANDHRRFIKSFTEITKKNKELQIILQ